MNWLMKGVGFENEQVYDDTIEKEKIRQEKQEAANERKRRKDELKARKAQEKADRIAKKYSLRQEKDIVEQPKPQKPQSTMNSYMENPDQYNTSRTYDAPVTSYGTNSTNVGGYGTKNVEFLYPQRYDDVLFVINFLKEGESVMLNLNNMNEGDSQRLLDCASGAVCALNGNIRRVDNNIFLLTPEGFNIIAPNNQQNPQNPQNPQA